MKPLYHILVAFVFAVSANAQLFELEEINQTFDANKNEIFKVDLNMDIGELRIEPSQDKYLGKINITHEKEEYWTKIDFDKKRNQLKIKIDNDSWFNFNNDDSEDDEIPHIVLMLPTHIEMDLDVRLKAGELEMELGGLSLKKLNVSSWAGETWINFDTLNHIEMEMMRIAPRIGECRLQNLGNSRFQRAKIDGGIGELSVDFSGGLLPDSRAKVDLDIGEASIELPEEVGTQMYLGGLSFLSAKNFDRSFNRRGRIYSTDNFDQASRKFYIKVSPGLGELNVDLR